MTIKDLDLEAAAVHAEQWRKKTGAPCKSRWESDGFTGPALAALGLTHYSDLNYCEAKMSFDILDGIWVGFSDSVISYAEAIDKGMGDEVAKAFREAAANL